METLNYSILNNRLIYSKVAGESAPRPPSRESIERLDLDWARASRAVEIRIEEVLLQAAVEGKPEGADEKAKERALVAMQITSVAYHLGEQTPDEIAESTFFVDTRGRVGQVYVARETPDTLGRPGAIELAQRTFPPSARFVGKVTVLQGHELLRAMGYAS